MNKLKHVVDEKKMEIEALRKLASGWQLTKGSYVPVANDDVDSALAEKINGRGSPLEISFARESAGTYIFGTKKVGIRLDYGQLIITVGQGQMGFDEFVNTYTSVEQEKWDLKKMEHSVRHR
jgi:hypothetical protein